MLAASPAELEARATRLRDTVAAGTRGRAEVEVVQAAGRAGGGALPLLELEGFVVSVRPADGGLERLQSRLRAQDPPIVARVREEALLLDPRTISDSELEQAATGVIAALD